jgi:DMSO/TMAO reductase YedYZ molybdopterin-dependent catalytic subunit
VNAAAKLPPGQHEIGEFPRFGLHQFATRFPRETTRIKLRISGEVARPQTIGEELSQLPRVEETRDFHCVTTWTHRSLRWSGFRFVDFFERIAVPLARPDPASTFVLLRGQDGYVTSLPLPDLLAESVILADALNGEPLSLGHGVPLRLVAPDHYGYKSVKYIQAIEFWRDARHYRPAAFQFMDHPRARVALEERGQFLPGRILRWLYRPLIGPTIRRFRSALDQHSVTPR